MIIRMVSIDLNRRVPHQLRTRLVVVDESNCTLVQPTNRSSTNTHQQHQLPQHDWYWFWFTCSFLLILTLLQQPTPTLSLSYDRPLSFGTGANGIAYGVMVTFPLTPAVFGSNLTALTPPTAIDPDQTGSIFILQGGYHDDGVHKNQIYWVIYPEDPKPATLTLPDLSWRAAFPVGPAPAARSYHMAISIHDFLPYKMLIYGGGDASQGYGSLWMYDLVYNEWGGLGPSPQIIAPTADECRSYQSQNIFGAPTSTYACSVDQCAQVAIDYPPSYTDAESCPWPGARGGSTFTIIGSAAYLFGGALENGDVVADLWKLDLSPSALIDLQTQYDLQRQATDSCYIPQTQCLIHWTLLTLPDGSGQLPSGGIAPRKRTFHSATTSGDYLFIFAGARDWYDNTQTTADIFLFDTVNVYWQQIPVSATPYTSTGVSILDRTSFFVVPVWTNPFDPTDALVDYNTSICNPNMRFVIAGGVSSLAGEKGIFSIAPPLTACSNGQILPGNLTLWTFITESWTDSSGSISEYQANFDGPHYPITFSRRTVYSFGGHTYNQPVTPQASLYQLARKRILTLPDPPVDRVGDLVVPVECRDSITIAQFIQSGVSGPSNTGCPFVWPAPRWYHSVVSRGTTMWMYGGYISESAFFNNAASSELFAFDVLARSWTLLGGSIPGIRNQPNWPFIDFPVFTITPRGPNGTLILWGGIEPSTIYLVFDSFWEYDLATGIWTNITGTEHSITPAGNLTKIEAQRMGARIISGYLFPLTRSNTAWTLNEDGTICYVFGGYIGTSKYRDALEDDLGSSLVADLWAFHLSNFTWELLQRHNYPVTEPYGSYAAGTPCSRYAASMVWAQGSLYLFPGLFDPGATVTTYAIAPDAWRYDLLQGRWSQLPLPAGFSTRQSATVGVLRNRILILLGGGATYAYVVYDSWEYDLTTNEWINFNRPGFTSGLTPNQREGAMACVFPELDQIVYFGGVVIDGMGDLHTLHSDDVLVSSRSTELVHDVFAAPSSVPLPNIIGMSDPTLTSQISFRTIAGAILRYQTLNVGHFRLLVESDQSVSPDEINASIIPITTAASFQLMYHIESVIMTNVSVGIRGANVNNSRPLLDCTNAGINLLSCFHLMANSRLYLSSIAIGNGLAKDGAGFSSVSSAIYFNDTHVYGHTVYQHGGAIFAMDSTIDSKNSIFELNSATLFGGGLYCIRSQISIEGGIFRHNFIRLTSNAPRGSLGITGIGGAIFSLSSAADIRDALFESNMAQLGGALGFEVFTSDSFTASLLSLLTSVSIQTTTFRLNQAAAKGGAIYFSQLDSDAPVLRSCTFINNSVLVGCGGAINLYLSLLQSDGCDFIGNSAIAGGGGAIYWENSLDDASYWTNPPNITFPPNRTMDELIAMNHAAYGSWLGSPAVLYRLSLHGLSNLTGPLHFTQISGQLLTPVPELALYDYFGNLVTNDDSSFFTMNPTDYLAGASSVRAKFGKAQFDSAMLFLPPTTTQTFTFSSSLKLPLLLTQPDNPPLTITYYSTDCQPGTFNTGQLCQFCPTGYYSSTTMASNCTICEPGSYANTTGSTSCYPCSLGTASNIYGLGSPCQFCAVDSFAFGIGETECHTCDVGIKCGLGVAQADKGRWIVNHNVSDGSQPFTISCPFQNCPGDGVCGSHRMNPPESNPLCGRCEDGYIEINHECTICNEPNGGRLFGAVIFAIALVIVLHRLARGGVGETEIIFYFIQSITFQTGGLTSWLSWISILDLSPSKASGGICFIPMDVYQSQAVDLFGPFILLGCLILIYCIHWSVLKMPQCSRFCTARSSLGQWFGYALKSDQNTRMSIQARARPRLNHDLRSAQQHDGSSLHLDGVTSEAIELHGLGKDADFIPSSTPHETGWLIAPYVRTVLSLYLLSYQQVSTVVLGHLFCINTGMANVVYISPTMDCDSSLYQAWRVVWILFFILFVFFGPIGLFLWLRYHHTQIRSGDRSFGSYFGVLYEGYSLNCQSWYKLFVLFRRCVFVVFDVFLEETLDIKILLFTLWNWALLLIHIKILPYQSSNNNLYGTVSLLCIAFISTLLMLGTGSNRSSLQLPISVQVLITLLFFIPLIWMCGRILWHKTTHFIRHQIYSPEKIGADLLKRQASQIADVKRASIMPPPSPNLTVPSTPTFRSYQLPTRFTPPKANGNGLQSRTHGENDVIEELELGGMNGNGSEQPSHSSNSNNHNTPPNENKLDQYPNNVHESLSSPAVPHALPDDTPMDVGGDPLLKSSSPQLKNRSSSMSGTTIHLPTPSPSFSSTSMSPTTMEPMDIHLHVQDTPSNRSNVNPHSPSMASPPPGIPPPIPTYPFAVDELSTDMIQPISTPTSSTHSNVVASSPPPLPPSSSLSAVRRSLTLGLSRGLNTTSGDTATPFGSRLRSPRSIATNGQTGTTTSTTSSGVL